MSVSASYRMALGVSETLEVGVDAAASPTIRLTGFDISGTLNSSSDVPATKVAYDSTVLSAGAKTIDLTNTVGTASATVDMTGLKVQLFLFTNAGTNVMVVSQGGSNPYNLGNGTWSYRVLAGQTIVGYFADLNPDVASGAKNIDIAGTGAEAFKFMVVAG